MKSLDPTFLLVLAALGWGLSIYFGFFRLRQYQWTRRKVELDLFTRLNRRGEQLFLRVTTLTSIKGKNPKIAAKRRGVLIKYLEGIEEKLLLIRDRAISPDLAGHWLRALQRELAVLYEQDDAIESELQQLATNGPNAPLLANLLMRRGVDEPLQPDDLFR